MAEPGGKTTGPTVRIPTTRDWIVSIECTDTGVVVSPGAIAFSIDAIMKGMNENVLRLTVDQMIARRQQMARPGEAAERPVIHFRVRPDGLRTYHLAYPVLESLRVPMTRENLRPEAFRRDQPAGVP
jgi:hypothetical protein